MPLGRRLPAKAPASTEAAVATKMRAPRRSISALRENMSGSGPRTSRHHFDEIAVVDAQDRLDGDHGARRYWCRGGAGAGAGAGAARGQLGDRLGGLSTGYGGDVGMPIGSTDH